MDIPAENAKLHPLDGGPMRAVILLLILCFASPAQAAVPNLLGLKRGAPYDQVRPRIIAMGYEPVRAKHELFDKCQYDDIYPCRKYPEVYDSPADAPIIVCLFRRRSDGRLIYVQIRGEEEPYRYELSEYVPSGDLLDIFPVAAPTPHVR